jgi:hypothetical protein
VSSRKENKPASNVSYVTTDFVQRRSIAVRASYVVSEILAKKRNHFCDGEIITMLKHS